MRQHYRYYYYCDGAKRLGNSYYENLPAGWAIARLNDVGTWRSGATPTRNNPKYYGGDIPWLKTGDLNDGTITNIPEAITELALQESSVRLNPTGSILIAMYGATIGKLGILTFPATTNQACCACFDFECVVPKFLFYFLLEHRDAFIQSGSGGAQPNISKEKITNTFIALPPLTEQRRIVIAIESAFEWLGSIAKNLS